MLGLPLAFLSGLLPAAIAEFATNEDERRRRTEEWKQTLDTHSKYAFQWLLRLSQVGAVLAALVTVATVVYAIVYHIMIPSRLHEHDLILNYGHHSQVASKGWRPISLPSANLSLHHPEQQWGLYDSSPKDIIPDIMDEELENYEMMLEPGMSYDIYLELVLPESDVNRKIGTFMVNTGLQSKGGKDLAWSARPALVRDAQVLVRWVRTGLWLIPQVLGLMEPTQTIRTRVFNGYKEGKEHRLRFVHIELNHPDVQVYSMKLTILAQLTGVRYLMYHWSVPTAALVIVNLVFLQALGLVILYAFYNMPAPDPEDTIGTTLAYHLNGNSTVASSAPTQDKMTHLDKSRSAPIRDFRSTPSDSAFFKSEIKEDLLDELDTHCSGGIAPVHVERKSSPGFRQDSEVDTATLLSLASAGKLHVDPGKEEEVTLRYRPNTPTGSASTTSCP